MANGSPGFSHQAESGNATMREDQRARDSNDPSNSLRLDQAAAGPSKSRRPRIALYSHDTMGLGHFRRNLLIAQSLAESELGATSLLITGAHEANFFSLPPGADCITLPRLQKDTNGNYVSGQLGISVHDLVRLRAESICSAMKVFQPDVFIVDKVPTGAFGELLPALRFMKQQFNRKCVLGIRDVLDDPETVLAEWKDSESHQAIEAFFDEIWVYGDPQVYDTASEYCWPSESIHKIRYTGYLNQSSRLATTGSEEVKFEDDKGQFIVCTLGGGQDGYPLARAFIDSLPESGFRGVLLTGPFMPEEQLRSLQESATNCPNLCVLKFSTEADQLISRADRVITMGGYNTVCSILSFQKKALLVPRVFPRTEQWIRAQKLQQLGLVDILHPGSLSSTALQQWMVSKSSVPTKSSDLIDLNGLARIKELCRDLVIKRSPKHSFHTREVV